MEVRYKIDKADEGCKIGDFLRQKGYSKRNIIALKKYPEKILVNGKWEYVIYILKDGDELILRFEEEVSSVRIEPQDIPIDIIYEDEDILVVNKPPFMPIHPTVNHERNTLANAVMYYYQKQGLEHVFRCMNRLDANTSGLTIMAKHKYSAAQLGDAMRNRKIHREYCAIVWGDDLYAPEHMLMNRQALHSAKLVFQHLMTGQEITLECPIPDDMMHML